MEDKSKFHTSVSFRGDIILKSAGQEGTFTLGAANARCWSLATRIRIIQAPNHTGACKRKSDVNFDTPRTFNAMASYAICNMNWFDLAVDITHNTHDTFGKKLFHYSFCLAWTPHLNFSSISIHVWVWTLIFLKASGARRDIHMRCSQREMLKFGDKDQNNTGSQSYWCL